MPLEGEDLVEVVGVPVLDGLVLGAGEQVVRPANEANALEYIEKGEGGGRGAE